MHILKRIGYYLGGLSIGLVILAFFLSGKKTSCSYFPQDRVLKNLRYKPYNISSEATASLKQLQLDTVTINRLFKLGDIDFGASEPRKKPCGQYVLLGENEAGAPLKMQVENCEKNVNIVSIEVVRN